MEDTIGQPIQGFPDCYRVCSNHERFSVGAIHQPQGSDGPTFQKQVVTDERSGSRFYAWKHIEGGPGPLDALFGGGGGFGDVLQDGFRYVKNVFGT